MIDPNEVLRTRLSDLSYWPPGTADLRVHRLDVTFELLNLVYRNLNPVDLPPVSLQTSTFNNGTSVQASERFGVNKKTTDTFTWTLTETLSMKYTSTVKVPIVDESSYEISLDFSASQAQTKSLERQWDYSAEIPVPPQTSVSVEFLVLERRISTPFTAVFRAADGQIGINYTHEGRDYDLEGTVEGYISRGFPRQLFQIDVSGVFSGIDATSYVVQARERPLHDPQGPVPTRQIAEASLHPTIPIEAFIEQ